MDPNLEEWVKESRARQYHDQPLMGGLLESIGTGLRHSYGQVRDDLSSILQGRINPGTFGRVLDVATELPLGKPIAKLGGLAGDVVGDVSKGIFGPIRTPAQKKVAKGIYRMDPEIARTVQESPRTMDIRIPMDVPWKPAEARKIYGNELLGEFVRQDPALYHYAAYTNLQDPAKGGTLHMNPRTLRGKIPPFTREPTIDPSSNLPSTALHEAIHFLNVPDVYAMNNRQAAQIANAVGPMLAPKGQRAVLEHLEGGRGVIALDETLAYLAERAQRDKDPTAKELYELLKPRPGGRRHPLPTDPKGVAMMEELGMPKLTLGPKLTPEEQALYEKMPRGARSFQTAEDLARAGKGEKLPPLGSALPDIKREVSSPGGLDIFEGLREQLGLPKLATYGKFKDIISEEEIPGIVQGIRERYIRSAGSAEEKARHRDSLVRAFGRAGPGPDTMDDFIKSRLDLTLQGLGTTENNKWIPGGPLGKVRFLSEPNRWEHGADIKTPNRLPPRELAALLHTLTKGGLLESAMEEGLRGDPRRPLSQLPYPEPVRQNLRRIESFLETAIKKKGK